jgi:glycosyltransferase involved in cell wall biosynthesis
MSERAGPGDAPVRMAYLLSQYPMLSMIFVIREVVQLRRLGFEIDVASINAADRGREAMTETEAAEAARTWYVIPQGVRGALAAHARSIFERPAGYGRGLLMVLRLGRADLRRLLMNFIYFTEALMVGAWMRRSGHRHLHVHLAQQAATVGIFVKQVFGCGLSMTVHGPDEFYDARGQYLEEKVAAADFVCCISFFARSQLMKQSPHAHWSKLVVSRLGVDPEQFSPRRSASGDGVFEILCVGRLVPAKGQHLLVEAFGILKQSGRSARLRIVGDGIDRASLESLAAQLGIGSSVVFEGAVNQDRIRSLYERADCFCLPSFAEGIPVVLMEAMAMEIPCVTTRITGIPELIRSGVEGLLVAPSDVDGLVQALSSLLDDPDLGRRLGRAGRSRVVSDYDLGANVDALAVIFRQRVAS